MSDPRPFDRDGEALPDYQYPYADDESMNDYYGETGMGVLSPGLEHMSEEIHAGLADLGVDPAGWSPIEATRHAYGDAGSRNYPPVAGNQHRSLYFHTDWLDADTAAECARLVPHYNAFDGELVAETIGEIESETGGSARFVFARESSPALYVYTTKPERVLTMIENMESEAWKRKQNLSDELDELAEQRDDIETRYFYDGLDPADFDGAFAMTLAAYKAEDSFPGGPPNELDAYYDAETYPHVRGGGEATNDAALLRSWWD